MNTKTDTPILEDKAHWTEVWLSNYSKAPGNRAHALTDSANTAGGALTQAWREAGNSFTGDGPEQFAKFLTDEVGPLVEGLFQEQLPAGPLTLPKPWPNPITGEPLPNPWLTKDNNAKKILLDRDPVLARYYQALAKNPYGTVAEIQDAMAAAARRKQIKYDATSHKENPFVTGNHTERSRLVVTDPERAEVYRREAKPVRLPWELGNRHLTGMGKLARNPELRAMVARAEELQQLWATEELSYTKSQLERNATAKQRLEAALNGGKAYAATRR